ncbi:TetR/AcrR family transcriptional regulator [Conexibacter arvalis]|uniref:AcrR family transcriptional regulator n=1 Tax=Conexibacter arvalis TaxID=912552 RepID=A0A840IL06_9ACTN|nr:TetR/AcrR family transcriptional regulator [Conexibacter arvalis]MBB4664694.1 AcrR family transcriptional regulator [Conexibacter arvalis]
MAAPRTRMALDVRREQLLDAGLALYARRAWEDVSIDEIARACGVSRGLLYHYFKGKREFYVATVEHAVARMHQIEPELSLPPTEQLRVGLERFFATIETEADAHAVLSGVPAGDAELEALIEQDRRAFADRVLAGMPGAPGGSPLAQATARAWIGAVGQAGRDWLERREVPREHLAAVLADALIASMLAAARLDPTIEVPAPIAAAVGGPIIEAVEAAQGERSSPPGTR